MALEGNANCLEATFSGIWAKLGIEPHDGVTIQESLDDFTTPPRSLFSGYAEISGAPRKTRSSGFTLVGYKERFKKLDCWVLSYPQADAGVTVRAILTDLINQGRVPFLNPDLSLIPVNTGVTVGAVFGNFQSVAVMLDEVVQRLGKPWSWGVDAERRAFLKRTDVGVMTADENGASPTASIERQDVGSANLVTSARFLLGQMSSAVDLTYYSRHLISGDLIATKRVTAPAKTMVGFRAVSNSTLGEATAWVPIKEENSRDLLYASNIVPGGNNVTAPGNAADDDRTSRASNTTLTTTTFDVSYLVQDAALVRDLAALEVSGVEGARLLSCSLQYGYQNSPTSGVVYETTIDLPLREGVNFVMGDLFQAFTHQHPGQNAPYDRLNILFSFRTDDTDVQGYVATARPLFVNREKLLRIAQSAYFRDPAQDPSRATVRGAFLEPGGITHLIPRGAVRETHPTARVEYVLDEKGRTTIISTGQRDDPKDIATKTFIEQRNTSTLLDSMRVGG